MKTETHEPQMGLNFEQVWAALMEDRAYMKELAETIRENGKYIKETREAIKETREAIKETSEQMNRTDEQIKETSEQMNRTDKRIERMSKNLGGLGESLGALIETLIAARLWKKFDAYHYNLKRAYQRIPIYDENNKIVTDIDILLSNGEYAMIVEVKREFDNLKYMEHHFRRMELVKKYPPAECKDKTLLSAIAGGTVTPEIRDYAHKYGFLLSLRQQWN
ncbi:hypothetical protein FACS1894102_2770 [Spirochaetia bacterium]|nr:hypothetical protein FACS1894102_2770 [Spirochaetia bacterium]